MYDPEVVAILETITAEKLLEVSKEEMLERTKYIFSQMSAEEKEAFAFDMLWTTLSLIRSRRPVWMQKLNEKPEKPAKKKKQGRPDFLKDELFLLVESFTSTQPSQVAYANSVYNALRRGGVNTPAQLKETSMEDISRFRSIGPKKLSVVSVMKDYLERTTK